ncbi:MAG: molybdopterin-binding/glycosyltransferase family 2 protein [Pseudomonadota bacterium]|nr:molybdopterin-binding/glycosyltransferase family 2 protein [Pseudomonadota bacterium]
MKFGRVKISDSVGAVLAHSARFPGRVLKKGHLIRKEDISLFSKQNIKEITVAQMEEGDIPENEAAEIIAKTLGGVNTTLSQPFTGRCNFVSDVDGLAILDENKLNRINLVHESVTVATVLPYSIVLKGQLIATIKIIPFSIPKTILDTILNLISDMQIVSVSPFYRKSIGLIMTRLPGMKENILDNTYKIAKNRVEEFDSKIVKEIRCSHSQKEVVAAINKVKEHKCDIILMFGASAVVDRKDILPAAVSDSGGEVEHFGMPVDPGNLLFLGKIADVPVVGMPGCARSPKLNGFDWVLRRLLCNVKITGKDIMLMGSGGLLKEISERGQLRQNIYAKKVKTGNPSVVGILLAGGTSKRMGKENKLLSNINGTEMVAHIAQQMRNSNLSELIVVTGYQSKYIKSALKGIKIETFVHNSDYRRGLSSSIKAGLGAVSKNLDSVMIFLGDMPLIKTKHINQLIRAFDPTEGREICIPVYGRKRGNPVLWDKRYLKRLISIKGDVGGRHLLEEFGDKIVEVEIDTDGILFDVDTPESLKELTARFKTKT